MEKRLPSANGEASPLDGIFLDEIVMKDASAVDRIKLVGNQEAPLLLYSTRTTSHQGSLTAIYATTPADPSKFTLVREIAMLLPSLIAWDARSTSGGAYELVYQEALGATNALAWSPPVGKPLSFTTHYPFENFFGPHFVRSRPQLPTPAIAAIVDDKKIVLFRQVSASQEPTYDVLDEADNGIVGGIVGGAGEPWVVIKRLKSGRVLFDSPPGSLALQYARTPNPGGGRQELVFPDRIAYEIDAAPLGDDVLVFATGKPSVLLMGSRRARPILLSAKKRTWLSQLSSPTLLVSETSLHVAALLNPGTAHAAVLYGSCAISSLGRR